QATIALLQAFHTQYPTRVVATDNLYAALVEYGRALRTAGDASSAADQFQQAVRLQPQRIEARAELAAMAPEPTPTREPTAAPEGRPSVDSDALGGKESLLGGPGGDLGPRAEAELPENATDVVLDGALAQHQAPGHGPVRLSLGDQTRDLLLAGRQAAGSA